MAARPWSSCPKKSWNAALGPPSPESLPLTPVLVGPTGVGKTAVAAALAALTPITVIAADARQIYRGLDTGTAKPGPETLTRVPHLGLDLIDPGERYSAGRFAREAAGWLVDVRAAGPPPGVGGGPGCCFPGPWPRVCSGSRHSIPNGAISCAAGRNRWMGPLWRAGPAGWIRAFPAAGASARRALWKWHC